MVKSGLGRSSQKPNRKKEKPGKLEKSSNGVDGWMGGWVDGWIGGDGWRGPEGGWERFHGKADPAHGQLEKCPNEVSMKSNRVHLRPSQ